MQKTSYSLLVEQKSPISIVQWDEIVRNLIMFSDTIWLHRSATAFDQNLDTALGRHYELVYHDLIDAGLIQFYSFESDSDFDCMNSSRVITREEHLKLYDTIIDKVNDPSKYLYDSLQDPERTSRIIEQRNELWKYGIATLLESEITFNYKYSNRISPEITNRSLNSKMTTELFSAFGISSLSHLDAKEIMALRKEAQKHRKAIQDITTKARTDPNTTITKVVNDEYREAIEKINQLATDVAGNGAIRNLVLNSTINIVGLIPLSSIILAPLTALVCGRDLFEFFRSRKKYGFVLFMNTLKNKSHSNPYNKV